MAEFCYECTEGLGARGEQNDFHHFGDKTLHDKHQHPTVLCEGCGWIQVDWEGKRVGPNPIKLQKELNGRWKAMCGGNYDREVTDLDRRALRIVVESSLKASGYDPNEFDIEVGIDEDQPRTVTWSYSKK